MFDVHVGEVMQCLSVGAHHTLEGSIGVRAVEFSVTRLDTNLVFLASIFASHGAVIFLGIISLE